MNRFNEVRASMPGQPKQSEIFSAIASRWSKMTAEEKKPYVDEAAEDKRRRKLEEQRYNHLRREIEKNYEVGNGSILRMIGTQNCHSAMRNIFKEKDASHLACLLLSMNKFDLKGTIDILQDACRLISTESAVRDYDVNNDKALIEKEGELHEELQLSMSSVNFALPLTEMESSSSASGYSPE